MALPLLRLLGAVAQPPSAPGAASSPSAVAQNPTDRGVEFWRRVLQAENDLRLSAEARAREENG